MGTDQQTALIAAGIIMAISALLTSPLRLARYRSVTSPTSHYIGDGLDCPLISDPLGGDFAHVEAWS